eukprot:TRINITY_DN3409_c0_g1_i1.p1 TRINITY_DN3409_c0_g1~~TRINITY_DN3409_c0_g1_i1.p1  ORF type:complete len:930 (-),score=164.71 TRINITY_DN3409_c0_g1_i1:624-3413(-)
MIRRVRRKTVQAKRKRAANKSSKWNSDPPPEEDEEIAYVEKESEVDWTGLPDDAVITIFGLLNYRDRATLACSCKAWRKLGSSPCLWQSLDLRAHRLKPVEAKALANRCADVQRLRFRGADSADVIIHLEARKLKEIYGEFCRELSDATFTMLAARHETLECLQLGPDYCERISSDAVRVMALCCPKLRRIRLSGLREIDAEAIKAIGNNCSDLIELCFLDCLSVDESGFGSCKSLRYLSVAGSRNMKWSNAAQVLNGLSNLCALDVSRTEVTSNAAQAFLTSQCVKVLCALNCPLLEDAGDQQARKPKIMLARFTDVIEALRSLNPAYACVKKEANLNDSLDFWNVVNLKTGEKNLRETTEWLEWVLSHSLLRIAESNAPGLDGFWLKQGAPLLLSLIRSSQEDVQERAATGLATFVVVDDENATVDPARAVAVMRGGGIRLLLGLAKSCREGVQAEAAKAIANLSVDAEVAKAVALEGGIVVLASLARSPNRLVAEEAAGGLWNLSVGEEHKGAIATAGGVKALVDLIFKWASIGDGVLERAAGALANLAADDKCSMEVAMAGGIHALVMLARTCKSEGVQEQAARALANLAAHGDSNGNNAAVGQEPGALEALVQLTSSNHEGVRQEAAGALWNLSFDDRNREAIAIAGGVEALVTLAQNCGNASQGLQERAAGALWGLSVSEANSIAIGREGGVAPLISLARSDVEDVHETAAGALWNLAFNPGNAWRIVEEGGVPALVHLCSSSDSKMARFMAALALAYMFDGRMEEAVNNGTLFESEQKKLNLDAARRMAMRYIDSFIKAFSDNHTFALAAASWAATMTTQIAESSRIQEAGHLRCSGAEVGRFVAMLKNQSPVLRSCAAFALLQFTIPGGRHAMYHASLLHKIGAGRVLRTAAASATAPLQAKVFARIVLRNLEQFPADVKL